MQANNKPLVSLCIPTNGVTEWVCPVLDSIYNQGVSEELYEVVITDNGNNSEFETAVQKYLESHGNLIYKKTNAYMFQNQIEAFKSANGSFIKFVNHRMILNDGALKHIIEFVNDNYDEKPIVYFLNNALSQKSMVQDCDDFEKFVENLSYYSSWSGGLAIWADDFKKIPDEQEYNLYFPHITILFYERSRRKYLIDNTPLMKEIQMDDTKKGKYNLFQAFAVEYVSTVGDLMRSGDISIKTFLKVKNSILQFLAELYWNYIVCKKKCSYNLDDYKSYLKVYYSQRKIRVSVFQMFFSKAHRKISDLFCSNR